MGEFVPPETPHSEISRFNAAHSDYLLVYSGLANTKYSGGANTMKYAEFSNASALIEVANLTHFNLIEGPVGHLGGRVGLTGK